MQVTLKHLNLSYHPASPLFKQLTCTFADGALTALVGPSGSGKTTLLNLVAGLLTPDSGQLFFDDQDVTRQDPRQRNIGMVFQDYALYPHLSVLDNIAFPLKMAHVKKAQRLAQARDLARLVHVDDCLASRPGALSGGQQQRVAIARALIKDPAVLLLDEPLSNVDAQLRRELRAEIARVQRQTGVTTILVTHDQTDALAIADSIMVLKHGVIQQVAPGATLYRHPANRFVAEFIGSPVINTLPAATLAPYITDQAWSPAWQTATTIGIRSEAVHLTSPNVPAIASFPATILQQRTLGRDVLTDLAGPGFTLQSTAIPQQASEHARVTVSLSASGCHCFDATGKTLVGGPAHA